MPRIKIRACFRFVGAILLGFTICLLLTANIGDVWIPNGNESTAKNETPASQIFVRAKNGRMFVYDRNSPLIFIGGQMRSGTTLMRAMLDTLPEVRCGEESMIILYLLYQRRIWMDNKVRWSNLAHAKVTDDMLDAAFSSFILEIVARHGEPAPRLCNKDPNSFRSLKYLSQLFPNAKFILMIRDGRGVVHSIFSRNYSVDGYDPKNPRAALEDWNSRISEMDEQCTAVGERCFRMYYEQLVLHPELNMRKVLKFLDLPWNKSVLNHETFIGTEISLSKVEWTTGQVVKPLNVNALAAWVGSFPEDVVRDMHSIAPMLLRLGYDPMANPPEYGLADIIVQNKTRQLQENREMWDLIAAKATNYSKKV